MLLDRIGKAAAFLRQIHDLPCVSVNLMRANTADNDPFYEAVTRKFHREATRRHRKFPLVRQMEYSAIGRIDRGFDDYFAKVEGAARRNFKKSARLGYRFDRINPSEHADDLNRILRSTDVRQGPMPKSIFTQELVPADNPVSRSHAHDYPYFGVFFEGHVVAFASCLIAGELCALQTIYGHAARQSDGIVPMLIISIVRYVVERHPHVKYYMYGGFFGANPTMKRFKKKFLFLPHHVTWVLG